MRPAAGHAVLVEVASGSGRIGILGPVELVAAPVPLGSVKERCLLAALAVHCGQAVSTGCLVDALWADDPPRTAAKTLQNYVLRVRRALALAGGPAIVTLPDGYCLRAAPGVVDAMLAESLIGEGRRKMAGGDPARAARLLRHALGLWRGPALGEFADVRGRGGVAAGELREAALEDLFDAELALGRHHEVAGGLEALVASGALRERRWGQLMVALYRDGRQAEALEAFARLRQVLSQDLGVDPGAELRRFIRRSCGSRHRAGVVSAAAAAGGGRAVGRTRDASPAGTLRRCRRRAGAARFCWRVSRGSASPTRCGSWPVPCGTAPRSCWPGAV